MERFERNPNTDEDVRQLQIVFGDLLPDGRLVTHQQIEAVIGVSHLTAHYRTVTNRWRKLLVAERSVYLDGVAAQGSGFVSLTPDEMVRFGNRGARIAGRKVLRSMAVMSLPDDAALSEGMRRYRARLSMAVAQIAETHRTQLRDVSRALAPTPSLPKRKAG